MTMKNGMTVKSPVQLAVEELVDEYGELGILHEMAEYARKGRNSPKYDEQKEYIADRLERCANDLFDAVVGW